MTVTDDILASYAPLANDASTAYLSALAGLLEQIHGLVADQGYAGDADWVPGWGTLLNPDTCPAPFLPYLAQFNGTSVSPGASEAVARQTIKAESGFARGTKAAIISAGQGWLNGTQTVNLVERLSDGGTATAWHFQFIVRTSELIDATGLTAAVNAVKPAGVTWTLVSATGHPWSSATKIWSAETVSWADTDNVAI